MGRFYPLYVRRSDGRTEIFIKGKRKELNQPTEEQLDQKPDKNGVSDFYREVASDETKHLDWRRKLGGMLARELHWKDKSADAGYILVTFPENYRLYEHVKKTERDGKTETKSKTHAGGGNDRQDAYLYGHPTGRKKRFRSPADFFPHLLWLCTDEKGDPDNCSCKICCSEDLEAFIPGAKAPKPDRSAATSAETPVSTPASVHTGNISARPPSASGPSVSQLKQEPTAGSVVPTAPPQPLPQPQQQQLMPTPLAPFVNAEQRLDSEYNRFLFRSGELVWFKRGQAWGLGVILGRWITQENRTDQYYYNIQPLAAPFGSYPAPVTKSSERELRPWLAWSVPRFTNDVLNQLHDPPSFETADWQGIMRNAYGNGNLEVDASILAAKAIDCSYTPFGLYHQSNPPAGPSSSLYSGIYLGAEKVWIGEPVRLQFGSGQDILVVHKIQETFHRSPTNPSASTQRSCTLIGDTYTLQTTAHANPAVPSLAAPNNNPMLPARLTQDLMFRNARSIQHKRQASYWKLVKTDAVFDINEIKGRWYEASLLLPTLQEGAFDQAASRGEIQEASFFMNGRLDCLNSNRTNDQPRIPRTSIRKETRRDAFGRAVPRNVNVVEGVQPPSHTSQALDMPPNGESMAIDPRFETAKDGIPSVDTGGSLEEFMDLDGLDDQNSMHGFGTQYGGQGPGYF